jgi:thiol:disulfide interchange protein DsbA
LKNFVFAALSMFLASAFNTAQAQSPVPVADTDYIEIPNGKPLDPADGKVVVEEFFNYICPACNSVEPQFVAWTAQLPSDVKIVHIPAAFRPDFVPYARAYYAAIAFGVAVESHSAVYNSIHSTHTLPAEGEKPDAKKIAAFYAAFGVNAEEFLVAMRSFEVDFKMRRGTDHMRHSRASGTPSVVVNGRYLVRGRSFADVLRTASYMVDKEREQ